jgi:hypothetical protein
MAFSEGADVPVLAPIRRAKTSLPAADKKQGSINLIGKLFGRQSEIKPVEPLEGETENLLDPETFLGSIKPCPFIRPLEHRLQARIEPIRSRRPPSNASSDVAVSPITKARKRGETNAILAGRFSDEDPEAADREDYVNGLPREEFEGLPDNLSISDLQQIEYVAVMASRHPDGVEHWRYYMECYTQVWNASPVLAFLCLSMLILLDFQGQFSLTNPPSPPQCSCSFKYLPAVYPPNEPERMLLCRRYDILWPQWAQQRVGDLMRELMKEFGTQFAALSVFDDRFEIFKVENGYNRSHIDRDISISAHVLFSSDVMVVLDTKKVCVMAT